MKTIFPGCSYDAILDMTNLPTLHDRRTLQNCFSTLNSRRPLHLMMTPVCPRLLNLNNDFLLLRFLARAPEDLSAIEVIYIIIIIILRYAERTLTKWIGVTTSLTRCCLVDELSHTS